MYFLVTVSYSFDNDGNFASLLETIQDDDVKGICLEMHSRSAHSSLGFF
jgi:hypothetical protein